MDSTCDTRSIGKLSHFILYWQADHDQGWTTLSLFWKVQRLSVHQVDGERRRKGVKMSYLDLIVVADTWQPETLQHINLICKRKDGGRTRRSNTGGAERKRNKIRNSEKKSRFRAQDGGAEEGAIEKKGIREGKASGGEGAKTVQKIKEKNIKRGLLPSCYESKVFGPRGRRKKQEKESWRCGERKRQKRKKTGQMMKCSMKGEKWEERVKLCLYDVKKRGKSGWWEWANCEKIT